MSSAHSFIGKGALLGMSALACAALVNVAPASAQSQPQGPIMVSQAAGQALSGLNQSVSAQDQATSALNARGAQLAARADRPQTLTFQVALVTLPGGEDDVQNVLDKAPKGAGFQQLSTYLAQALPKATLAVVPPSGIVTSWNGHMVADIVFVQRIPFVSAAGNLNRDIFIGQGIIGGCQANGQPLVVNGITLSSPVCTALLQTADIPRDDRHRVIGGTLANYGTSLHIDITNDEMPNNQIGGHMQAINVSPVRFDKIEHEGMTVVLPVKTANTMDREFIAPKGMASIYPLPYNTHTHSRLAVVLQPNNAQ
ncbi:hypothetical protein E3E11_02090 [Oecophyllibacter saccharovorans]|uniref:hypothetical protein n=1 Tax=Oecophyllibacter saccharovorans TaxID=2558360 RepID=UPI0011427627|nr:hypothetical protein [Oecophyllibacter saccharovorans]QDH14849.1 hypothetical protein E3E11_02090 [Oecophyllibacter saccharovorans]